RERSREAPRRIEEEEGEIGDLVTLVQDPRAAEPFGEVEIRLLLDRLTPKEKGVLSAFLQGGTLAAFARQEGIARQTAGIYLKRALHKLRRGWDL
ncbi:MAG: hypothetical protein IRY98_11800, partial [Alicyclobacillaceae bacterium]|nr:hypothetical protein [Alicyclobacillaceae bacterium]